VALTVLLFVTLASVAWSLWIRRLTWHCRWEVAATLNIALQGLAVALMSPLAADTLGAERVSHGSPVAQIGAHQSPSPA